MNRGREPFDWTLTEDFPIKIDTVRRSFVVNKVKWSDDLSGRYILVFSGESDSRKRIAVLNTAIVCYQIVDQKFDVGDRVCFTASSNKNRPFFSVTLSGYYLGSDWDRGDNLNNEEKRSLTDQMKKLTTNNELIVSTLKDIHQSLTTNFQRLMTSQASAIEQLTAAVMSMSQRAPHDQAHHSNTATTSRLRENENATSGLESHPQRDPGTPLSLKDVRNEFCNFQKEFWDKIREETKDEVRVNLEIFFFKEFAKLNAKVTSIVRQIDDNPK